MTVSGLGEGLVTTGVALSESACCEQVCASYVGTGSILLDEHTSVLNVPERY